MSNSSGSGKQLLKGTGIYAVGTFGTKILMFLIVPLYTYYLDPSEMGTYDVLIGTIGLLLPIISLQISDSVYRWVIREDADALTCIGTSYRFLFVSSFITVAVVLAVNFFISIPYMPLFLCALLSSLFFQFDQKVLRGLKRQWLFAISGIVYTVTFLALNIVLLCVLHGGVESLLISYSAANAIGLLSIMLLEDRLQIQKVAELDLLLLKKMLLYSIPLIPNYLSWWIVESSDKYIVLLFIGVNANGLLAVAHKFPTILQAVFGLFLNSWQDLAVANDKADKEFFTSVFRRVYRFSFAFIWALVPITKIFVWLIMGAQYKSACDYIPFFYLGAIFQAFCSFYGVGYLRTKNTKGAFSSSVYGACINAVVNIGLIWLAGLQAAAISTFIAFFVMWLIRVMHNGQELGIRINWAELWLFLLIGILICVGSILMSPGLNVVLAGLGTVGFFILNYRDIRHIIGMIRRR